MTKVMLSQAAAGVSSPGFGAVQGSEGLLDGGGDDIAGTGSGSAPGRGGRSGARPAPGRLVGGPDLGSSLARGLRKWRSPGGGPPRRPAAGGVRRRLYVLRCPRHAG